MIADHPTPKIQVGGGTAYTLNSRDYKGVMIVVVSESNNSESVGFARQSDCGQQRHLSDTQGMWRGGISARISDGKKR